MIEAADLAGALIRAPSVTPEAGPALDVLEEALRGIGFEVHRPVFSEPGTPDVENLFAAIGTGEYHLAFAGHVDVVPPGEEAAWRHPPFSGALEDGVLYGRGAVDMKSAIAAMAGAASRFLARRPQFGGRLSFLVTGDEEGPSVNGTKKLLAWAAGRGERFSAALVGEPTSAGRVGDQIKVGRRGSFSVTLAVSGRQGHAAYPHLADNPVPLLMALLAGLVSEPLDTGSERFEPSTLQIVDVSTGNEAWNVIPGSARARLNSRFNDMWTRDTLRAEFERRIAAAATALGRDIEWRLEEGPAPSESFLTREETLIASLSDAVAAITGARPALSTGGGTSDARFIKDYCPVVELGLVGRTMHQTDERAPVSEIGELARIYEAFLDRIFKAA
ncbi:succinyl-diaminopimelate desuccinylase [Afifella sp. IM 167]|uniref:succinyl-diaminopimelate desuccinylase n=1 Tax=Afifella sp. IM 167 TaxID=2033586 RepID=UPI001CCD958B|nr:succinyl-diaminopimelate desuccinylase [Afifella sp. IM 167]MBZ8133802.1 succinyl-diaminopimelate desuccinylase [Afifella sp. IM 167]